MSKKAASIVLRDAGITTAALGVTFALCLMLRGFGDNETFAPLLFVLCVLSVSRLTDGYVFGIVTSVAAVLGVNYVFTYPYMELDFAIAGYPLTFAVMLAVSLVTSTMTTRAKRVERLKLEADRERMRANLLRGISHDLRTPLTTICGSADTMLMTPDMPEQSRAELLTGVRDDAQWLLRMVENLLSVTRVENGEASIHKTEEVAEEVVAEAAGKFKKNYPEAQVSVSVPEEPLFVPMDAVLIEQVLANLMENAVIHGEKTKHIWVRVTDNSSYVVFSVIDDGAGVSREAETRLFRDYFEQAELRGASREKRNMGIGLSVCASIVKAHGGAMSAVNNPDGGACFSFTLPLN